MSKALKIVCLIGLIILAFLLFYSSFTHNRTIFVAVQLIVAALFVGFGIDAFIKKQRYHGFLCLFIATGTVVVNIQQLS
ncbi:hypothetical protein KQI37_06500 [Bacillus halotolerans]|uniref:hypothetical protein n=1 Tax=Bacillus halotolerans TaxID=260554 RepID=UPI001C0EAA76|nr:hypothetical protein [Bacillus halotolerans]MBU5245345.1 hypothetical protein [Bacillus halotolerans]